MNAPSRSSDSQGIWLLLLAGILLFGLHLRLETAEHTRIQNPTRADAGDYTAYAYNLDRHGIYSRNKASAFGNTAAPQPDALRSPGYPAFLSLLTSSKLEIFITRSVYTQALISTLTLIIIALLANAIVGKLASLIVVLLAAISPHLILANSYILTETFYTFFLCLTLLTIARAQITGRQMLWMTAAILLAATTLIRPTTQYFIFLLAALAWYSTDKNNRAKISSVVVLIFVLISSIWMIRNLQAIGQPSDPQLMINGLHHGMYPGFMHNNQAATYGFPYRYDPQSADISGSVHSVLAAIFERFINQPIEYIKWYCSKPAYFFQWDLIQGNGIFIYPALTSTYYAEGSIFDLTHSFMRFMHPVLVIMSIAGIITGCLSTKYTLLSNKQRRVACLLSTMYLYFIFIHIIVAPFPRYSIPIRPLTYLLALLAAYSATLNIKTRIGIPWKTQTISTH